MSLAVFGNIISKVGEFLSPPGVLVSEQIGVDASGARILSQTFRLPSGALEIRSVPVTAEHRPIVQPSVSVGAVKVVADSVPPVVERVDRRSIDRGDRDPRMPVTAADRSILPTGERRSGGPLQSVFQEVKSMMLSASGWVFAGLIVFTAVKVLADRARR